MVLETEIDVVVLGVFCFVFAILKPILKLRYQNRKHSFTVQSTVLSQCVKMHAIICHHWSQRCPPCVLGSADTAIAVHRGFGCC